MSQSETETTQATVCSVDDRLNSWKEIAAYLGRDESTLRRWEIKEALPIHRDRQKSRVVIYAYKWELDTWRSNRNAPQEPTTVVLPPVVLQSQPSLKQRAYQMTVSVAVVLVIIAVLAVAFTRWRVAKPRPAMSRIQSLALLPLHDASGDPHEEYFADAMTEAVNGELAQIKNLRVMAPASMMPYKNVRRPLGELARDWKLDAVIEGVVARTGDHAVITVRLIDTRSTSLIWSNTYKRAFNDVLAVPSEVAAAVAHQTHGELAGEYPSASAHPGPINVAALEGYFRGVYHWNQFSCDGFKQALEDFQQAAAAAPNLAVAHGRLAHTYIKLGEYGCLPQREMISRARASAARAIALDPDLAEAHSVLGLVSFLYDWDWGTASGELRRAAKLAPNDATAHSWYGAFLFAMGHPSEAFTELKRAHDIDPVPGATSLVYAFTLYNSRRYDEAIARFQKVVAVHPNSVPAYFGLAASYERKRVRDKALKNYIAAKELSGMAPERVAALRKAASYGGLKGYWRKELQLAAARPWPDTCRSTLSAAHIGNKEQTLGLLERAYYARCSSLTSLKIDPVYDKLRPEPRFQNIVRRMALPNSGAKDRARKPANIRIRSAEKTPQGKTG